MAIELENLGMLPLHNHKKNDSDFAAAEKTTIVMCKIYLKWGNVNKAIMFGWKAANVWNKT